MTSVASLSVSSSPTVRGDAPTAAQAANPFGGLLASLDAMQQPAQALLNDGANAATAAPPATSIIAAQSAAPPTTVTTQVDEILLLLGPAFNSRLSPTQVSDEQLAAARGAPLPPMAEAALPQQASSLLALLAAKTQPAIAAETVATPAVVAAAPEPETIATDVPAADLHETVLITASALPLLQQEHPALDAIAPDDSEESSSDDAAAMTDAITAPLIAMPAAPAPDAPMTLAMKSAADDHGITEIATATEKQAAPAISLFEKLSAGTEATTQEAPPEEAPSGDMPATASETEMMSNASSPAALAPVTDDKVARTQPSMQSPYAAQAVQPQAASESASSQSPTVPQVTLRPVNNAHMVEGVSVLVTRASASKINEFVIRMDPPELGRIDVQLKMQQDGTVQAVIASDNPNTHDLLRREASTIERALADSGLKTNGDSLNFNLKQQGGESQQQAMHMAQSRTGASRGTVEAPVPETMIAPLRQRYDNARVNISA